MQVCASRGTYSLCMPMWLKSTMHDMQLMGKTYMRCNACASRGIYSNDVYDNEMWYTYLKNTMHNMQLSDIMTCMFTPQEALTFMRSDVWYKNVMHDMP